MNNIDVLLESWGVPSNVIDVFKANEINTDQLVDLYHNKDMLKELVPLIGVRLRLLLNLKQWMAENKVIAEISTDTESDTSCGSNIAIQHDTPIDLITIDSTLETSTIFDLSLLREKMPDFHLKTLLSTSPLGNSVLKFYETHKYLDETRKNRLSKIIVRHLFNYIVKNKLSDHDYVIICHKILELFPNEKSGVYFTPSVPLEKSAKRMSEPKRGKLYHQVRNILYLSGETKRKVKGDDYGKNPKRLRVLNDLKEQHADDVLWLKANLEPWDTVVEKWNKTFEIRRSIQNENLFSSVEDIFKEWPVLYDLRGDVLINLDFEKLYPTASLQFFQSWNEFFQKILNRKAEELSDSVGLQFKEDYLSASFATEDEKLSLELTLLCYLVPPKGRVNKNWKISTIESVEGIIVQAKVPGDIPSIIDKQRDKAAKKGRKVQPYLLVEGPTLTKINTSYVVIDNIKYQFRSVIKAFDTLIKAYHVFHIEYPPQTKHIYLLIQQGVYKLFTSYDCIIPGILDLL